MTTDEILRDSRVIEALAVANGAICDVAAVAVDAMIASMEPPAPADPVASPSTNVPGDVRNVLLAVTSSLLALVEALQRAAESITPDPAESGAAPPPTEAPAASFERSPE